MRYHLIGLISSLAFAACSSDAKVFGEADLDVGGAVGAGDTASTDTTAPKEDTTVVMQPSCQTIADCVAAMTIPPCQKPMCAGGLCQLAALGDGAPCDSGDPCTVDETCGAGTCGGGRGLPCDDADPCTADSCTGGACAHVPTTGGCDDGDPCTIADYCKEGTCTGGNNVCPCDMTKTPPSCAKFNTGDPCVGSYLCQAGKCVVDESTASQCPTGALNACRVLGCVEGDGACAALPLPKGTPCDDGDPCTLADACEAGVCTPGQRQCPCTEDAECASYDDGDKCNGTLSCTNGQCVLDASTVVSCKDLGDPCAATACDPATGQCVNSPSDGKSCDDGDPCTGADACDAGLCHGTPPDCNDDNECTTDGCGADGGCVHTPRTGGCDDMNSCTKDDQCSNGVCQPGEDQCSCNVDSDCAKFDDGDTCTGVLVCLGKQCTPKLGSKLECDQTGNTQCAEQTCKNSACSLQPVNEGIDCSDSNACTSGEKCQNGECVGGTNLCACSPKATNYLQCGEIKKNWSNAAFGFTDAVNAWTCAPGDWSAKEFAWPFFTNKPVAVTITLQEESVATSLFLLRDKGDGCVPASCVKQAPSTLKFVAYPDETIYIVVDGKDGAEGKFGLEVACNTALELVCNNGTDEDGDGLLDCLDDDCAADPWCSMPEDCLNGVDDDNDFLVDCADPGCSAVDECHTLCSPSATAYCGFNQIWSTGDSANNVSNYSCGVFASGPDFFYTFNATQSQWVTVDLPQAFFGAQVTVMEHQVAGCNGANCIAGGPAPLSFSASAGTTYYIGIDGQSMASGQFQVKVTCE